MRYSHQRELILREVLSRSDYPTAEQICTSLRAVCPRLSLGTVYRDAVPYKQFVGSSQFFNMQWGQVSAGSGDPALPNVLCSITHYKMLRRERS